MSTLFITTPARLPPTDSITCFCLNRAFSGSLRGWTTIRVISTSLTMTAESLTPRMEGIHQHNVKTLLHFLQQFIKLAGIQVLKDQRE